MGIQVLFLEGTRCCSLWPWRRQDILQKESDFARLLACPPALLPGQKLLAWQRGSVPVPGLVSSALCGGDNEPWNSPDQHPLTTPGQVRGVLGLDAGSAVGGISHAVLLGAGHGAGPDVCRLSLKGTAKGLCCASPFSHRVGGLPGFLGGEFPAGPPPNFFGSRPN